MLKWLCRRLGTGKNSTGLKEPSCPRLADKCLPTHACAAKVRRARDLLQVTCLEKPGPSSRLTGGVRHLPHSEPQSTQMLIFSLTVKLEVCGLTGGDRDCQTAGVAHTETSESPDHW